MRTDFSFRSLLRGRSEMKPPPVKELFLLVAIIGATAGTLKLLAFLTSTPIESLSRAARTQGDGNDDSPR